MSNITIHRYHSADTRKYWQGWIEPEDRSWIVFVRADGSPIFFLERDSESGAVLVDEDVHIPYPGWIKRGTEDEVCGGWLADPIEG